jgi:hypothetical protein
VSLASLRVRLALVAAVGATGAPLPVGAQDDPPPPDTRSVCPSIEEDGLLCVSDPLRMTGNCGDFAAAATRLAALYRAELAKLPGSKASLLTTQWWGCGPDSLYDVKRLLVSLDTPAAKAALAEPPYPSLPAVPPPPPPPSPDQPFTCIDLPKPVDRAICAGATLQAVRGYHEQQVARCEQILSGDMLAELVAAESTFEQRVRVLCEDDTNRAGEKGAVRAFDRAECMVQSYRDRTKAMLEQHPACGPNN